MNATAPGDPRSPRSTLRLRMTPSAGGMGAAGGRDERGVAEREAGFARGRASAMHARLAHVDVRDRGIELRLRERVRGVERASAIEVGLRLRERGFGFIGRRRRLAELLDVVATANRREH